MVSSWMRIGPLAILLVPVSAPWAQWTPPSGPITAGIYTLLARDGALFAGTDGQGAFRSQDRGATWETVNAGFPERQGVYAFAGYGGRLFAGTYDGVYYSGDNGKGWIRSNHENWPALHVVALAGLGKFLFAPSNMEFKFPYNRGIFRSADSGLTWTPVNNGFTATIWINTLARHTDALFVGTSGEGVFRSTDSGESWTPFNKGLPDPIDTDPRSFFSQGDKLYAGNNHGVYVLSGGNDSWTRISKGLPDPVLITSIAAYGSHLFAGSALEFGGGVFHSADGGASWRRVGKGGPQPVSVASLAVLGDELFASTGETTCGELGCNGSTGGVWSVSIPRLLGTTAMVSPAAGQPLWKRLANPRGAYDAAGRRLVR